MSHVHWSHAFLAGLFIQIILIDTHENDANKYK